jgi:hypothetical protein
MRARNGSLYAGRIAGEFSRLEPPLAGDRNAAAARGPARLETPSKPIFF